MRRSLLAGIAVLAAVAAARGSSPEPTLSRDTVVENDRSCSPNGRFCLVLRQFEAVPDLGGERADRLFEFPPEALTLPAGASWLSTSPGRGRYASSAAFPATSAALYDGNERVAQIELEFPWRGGAVLVADSGRHAALFSAVTWNNERSPALSIYRSDGSRVRTLFLDEILSPGDVAAGVRCRWTPELRESGGSDRDLLLLTAAESPEPIRIDLATGSRFGELRDLCPRTRP